MIFGFVDVTTIFTRHGEIQFVNCQIIPQLREVEAIKLSARNYQFQMATKKDYNQKC